MTQKKRPLAVQTLQTLVTRVDMGPLRCNITVLAIVFFRPPFGRSREWDVVGLGLRPSRFACRLLLASLHLAPAHRRG